MSSTLETKEGRTELTFSFCLLSVGRRKEMLEEVAALVKDQAGSVIP